LHKVRRVAGHHAQGRVCSPEINARNFFDRLLADPDINGDRQWAFAVVADGKPAMKPASLHQLLAEELSRASRGLEN
jgi:hypothetical protein